MNRPIPVVLATRDLLSGDGFSKNTTKLHDARGGRVTMYGDSRGDAASRKITAAAAAAI